MDTAAKHRIDASVRRWRKWHVSGLEATVRRPISDRTRRLAPRLNARVLALEADRFGSAGPALAAFAEERVFGRTDFQDINFLELAIAKARSVGRVVGVEKGTGFLISPSLMLTNQHVIRSVADARATVLQMDFQTNARGESLETHSFSLRPDLFFRANAELDYAIVAVAGQSARGRALASYGWLKLLPEPGKAQEGDAINIVQHPRGQMKQIVFRGNRLLKLLDQFLHYEADTDPGSSGSPCFNDLWDVVALHHSAVPRIEDGHWRKKDGSIWRRNIDSPHLIDWVANEGVRISAISKDLMEAKFTKAAQGRLRDQVFEAEPRNAIELARESAAPAGAVASTDTVQVEPDESGHATVMVPVTLRLRVAEAAPRVEIDPDYTNRKGYDAKFISGLSVPTPRLTKKMQTSALALPYHHFSVLLDTKRRTARWTAVNIDGSLTKNLGPRAGDIWFEDPRAKGRQVLADAYRGNALDKGHLVRRLDPAWGSTLEEARRAANDTFHYSNAAPQHQAFNQGSELWLGLEDFLLTQAAKKRMTIFTGAVLADDDPQFQQAPMAAPIQLPRKFWKVAVLERPAGKFVSIAFVMSQAALIGDGTDLEKFEPALHQVTVARVASETGLNFGRLAKLDVLGAGTGVREAARERLILTHAEIILDALPLAAGASSGR